jgi:3-deoxy-D-manno-octulosonic-acid transferase
MWFLYNILFAIGYLALLPMFLLRMRRRGGYRQDFGDRFGCYAPGKRAALGEGGRIWVHAVSVGEALVALSFIQSVRETRPGARFVISTTTSTGHALLAARHSADDLLIYYPLDFPWIVRRAVQVIKPSMLVLTECELWPNLLRALNRRQVPVVVINGRISESSFRGYSRVRLFFRRAAVWVRHFLVQTETDARRLAALGVPAEKLTVTGSVKFDAPLAGPGTQAAARQIVQAAGMNPQGRFWVAGSTWPGEESAVLAIFNRLHVRFPDLQLILVPRHMERRQEVVQQVEASGLTYALRSAMQADAAAPLTPVGSESPAVLVADTTGELFGYYSIATLVFVGKSLGANHGGQNPIEPAALAKPVIVGPNMENFQAVIEEMLSADALVQVPDADALESACLRLLENTAERNALAARAGAMVAARRGVMARTVAEVLALGC